MALRRRMFEASAAAMLLGLAACGHRFPFGEKLLPQSYGPPFGAALDANRPEHPHNPASSERHAAADAEKNRAYRDHAACHGALERDVLAHHGKITRVSPIESIGHYQEGGVTHEHRCSDYVLSYRSWCPSGAAEGGEHKEMHKKPEAACKGEGSGH